ncbi:MAG: hypothetical protein KJN72_10700 [Woeseia sp.]|nr:hypothetical protein [Woeseia sp.]
MTEILIFLGGVLSGAGIMWVIVNRYLLPTDARDRLIKHALEREHQRVLRDGPTAAREYYDDR